MSVRPVAKRPGRFELDLYIDRCQDRLHRVRRLIPDHVINPRTARQLAKGEIPRYDSKAGRWISTATERALSKAEAFARTVVLGSSAAPVSLAVAQPAEHATPKRKSPRWADFVVFYENNRLPAIKAKPATVKTWSSNVRNHLTPVIGERRRIDEIGPEQILAIKNRGLKASTTNTVLATLKAMLNFAVEQGKLEAPPLIKSVKEARRDDDGDWFTPEELERLIAVARSLGKQEHVFVLLGAHAGLRVGEICALRWKDVDLADDQMNVCRNFSKNTETTPKGGRSRKLKISKSLRAALVALKGQGERSGRVLIRDGGKRWTSGVASGRFSKIAKEAGLVGSPHKLRHTCGSILGKKFPVHEVARFLGHASAKTTMRYMHTRQESVERMAASLG